MMQVRALTPFAQYDLRMTHTLPTNND